MSSENFQTVYEAFVATTEKSPDNAFLCVPKTEGRDYYPEGVEFTYAQSLAEIDKFREVYKSAGFGHGHRVAILMGQRPEFFFHYLALNSLGVGTIPINPEYRHDETLYQMEDSDADLAIAIASRVDDLEAVSRERKRPLPVINVEDFPSSLPSPGSAPKSGAPNRKSEASVLYTSGTTGRPKGCMLENDYFITAGQLYITKGGRLNVEYGKDRLFNPLPVFHMNGQALAPTAMILSGNCLILPDRFHPTSWWDEIKQTGATMIHYLGAVPPMLMNQPSNGDEKQPQIKFGLGAGIDPQLHIDFEARFGFPLVEVWGMTETGRIFADCIEPRKIDTRAFGSANEDEMEALIMGEDGVTPCGVDEPGELLVRCRGDNPKKGFFQEYINKPDATDEAWEGGWFHTGDIVRRDAEGMMYFVDRKKNIIRRSGENIAAAEIEACMNGHDYVAASAVIAAPDEVREEEVMACLVLMEGVEKSEKVAHELMEHALEKLAYYKTPGWFLFLDDLPMTGSQKIQKSRIFEPGEDPRESVGIIDTRSMKKRRKAS